MFQWIWSGYFSELSGLSASLAWAVWVYQLPREFGSFNGLAVLCISVDCVRLGVLWQFSRLVVMGVQLSGRHTCIYFWIKGLLIMYTWHLNQQFPCILTLLLHNKMRLNVNLHLFCNPVHVVNILYCQVR